MESKRCYGCMQMKTQTPICEHCGFNEYIENLPHQLPIGTILHDRYEVGKVLGQGGFGITYLCWDRHFECAVAVKEYYPNGFVTRSESLSLTVNTGSDDPQKLFLHNRQRFLKEARAMAKFRDVPSIVHVENYFEENNTVYIVMEYIKGVNLKTYLNFYGGKMSAKKALSLLLPVMECLEKVHQEGLVHRDISPDNIMITMDRRVKLLDFGAAWEANGNRSTEVILKHGFAPIEQYQRSGALGAWTDTYAMCATLYYCLTGQIPPDAPNRIMETKDIPWADIPGLTQQQVAALNKGMAVMPKDRISSMGQLRAALTEPVISEEERREQERLEREKQERERKEKERLEQERQERERREKERLEQERKEKERIAREQQRKEQERLAREKREREKQEREQRRREEREAKRQQKESGGSSGGSSSGNSVISKRVIAIAAAAVAVVVCLVALPGKGEDKDSGSSHSGPSITLPGKKPSQKREVPTENLFNDPVTDEAAINAMLSEPAHETLMLRDGSNIDRYFDKENNECARLYYDKEGNLQFKSVLTVNKNGNDLCHTLTDGNGNILRRDENQYDVFGNHSQYAMYLDNDRLNFKLEYTYDDNDELLSYVRTLGDGSLDYSRQYTFSKDGKTHSYVDTYADGTRETGEFRYDENGRMLSSEARDSDGNINYRWEYSYNDKGQQTKQTYYRGNSKSHSWQYEYDAAGNRFKEYYLDSSDTVGQFIEYHYDTHGTTFFSTYTGSYGYSYRNESVCTLYGTIAIEYQYQTRNGEDDGYSIYSYTVTGSQNKNVSFTTDGTLESESIYDYDEDGTFHGYTYTYYSSYDGGHDVTEYNDNYDRIRKTEYDKNNKVENVITYEHEYDDKGNLTKETAYNSDGSLNEWNEYYFDANGVQTGSRYCYVSTYDKSYTIYEYDANYNTISREEYTAKGILEGRYTYEYEYDSKGNKVKETVTDQNGKVDSWTEYFYDENGMMIDSEYHWN